MKGKVSENVCEDRLSNAVAANSRRQRQCGQTYCQKAMPREISLQSTLIDNDGASDLPRLGTQRGMVNAVILGGDE